MHPVKNSLFDLGPGIVICKEKHVLDLIKIDPLVYEMFKLKTNFSK